MARTQALSIYVNESTKAELINKIGGVFENLAKATVSGKLKSKNFEEKAGSFEYKRFANATSQAYGTARSEGKGQKIKAPGVVVNLDQDKEIVEEVNAFDGASFTEEDLNAFLKRRQVAIEQSIARDLDRAFFGCISASTATKGADVSKADNIREQIGEIIVALETTSNEYVDGVEREQMALVVSPALYQAIKNELNDCYNFAGTTADEIFKGLDGVAVFSSNRLPSGVSYVLMTMDAIAQPVMITNTEIEKIPLSNEYAVEAFYRYGANVIAKDLVVFGGFTA
jgi:hypothetical protein